MLYVTRAFTEVPFVLDHAEDYERILPELDLSECELFRTDDLKLHTECAGLSEWEDEIMSNIELYSDNDEEFDEFRLALYEFYLKLSPFRVETAEVPVE